MPRAIWSGSISFGLVNIPVKLYSAINRKSVKFNQLDVETGARIKQKRVSAIDGEEVPYERIVKGYELASGEYVTVTEDEMAGLDPEAVRTIDIDQFVDLADIDPIVYDNAYHLVPDQATAKPYKLLATAMEEAGKVGVASFVMRTKQYLAAVRPKDGKLLLSTMVYEDEIVGAEDIGGFDVLDDLEVEEKELAMAEQLIATLEADWDHEQFRDTYREAVISLIERKADGTEEAIVVTPEATSDKVIDLMAALEASVAEAKQARKRHPAAGEDTAPAKKAKKAKKKAKKAKKTAAKKATAKTATKRARKSA